MRKLTLILLIIIAFFVFACEPNEDAEEESDDGFSDKKGSARDKESADLESLNGLDTSRKEAGKEEGLDDDLFEDFLSLISKKKKVSYKVEYDFSSRFEGQIYSGKQTQVMKGEKLKIETGIGKGKSALYYLKDATYMCSDAHGETSCLKFSNKEPTNQLDASAKTNEDIEQNPLDYDINPSATKTIAGARVFCFKIASNDATDWTAESCYTIDGIHLYLDMTGIVEGKTFESTLIATSFSKTVLDSEFDLPAEPADLSALIPEGIDTPIPNNYFAVMS
jgi:hypothetical protein